MSDPVPDPRVTRADTATTVKLVGDHVLNDLAWVKPHIRNLVLEYVKDELHRRANPARAARS